MEVSIEIKGIEKVNESLNRLRKFLKKPAPFYKDASTLMKKDVLKHFEDEKGDENVRWKKSLRAIREHGRTLQNIGHLKQSIQKTSDFFASIIGTNLDYAPSHNYGLKGMPERRFLWVSKSAGEKIRGLMIRHIGKKLK